MSAHARVSEQILIIDSHDLAEKLAFAPLRPRRPSFLIKTYRTIEIAKLVSAARRLLHVLAAQGFAPK